MHIITIRLVRITLSCNNNAIKLLCKRLVAKMSVTTIVSAQKYNINKQIWRIKDKEVKLFICICHVLQVDKKECWFKKKKHRQVIVI